MIRRRSAIAAAVLTGALAATIAVSPAQATPAGSAVAAGATVSASAQLQRGHAPTLLPAKKPTVFKNCTALNKKYPHGVGLKKAKDKVRGKTKPVTNFTRNDAVYKANSKHDRDKDGIACEKR